MKDMNDVSLFEFTETVKDLERLAVADNEAFEDFVLGICREFRLAHELANIIATLVEGGVSDEDLLIPDANFKTAIAMWLAMHEVPVPAPTQTEQ